MKTGRFIPDSDVVTQFQRSMNKFYEINNKLSIDDFIKLFPRLSKISIDENKDAQLIASHMNIYDSIQTEPLSNEAEKELRYVAKSEIELLDQYLSEIIPKIREFEISIIKGNRSIETNNRTIEDKLPEVFMPFSQPDGGITVLNIAPLVLTNFPSQKLPLISNPFNEISVGEREQNAFEYLESSLRERRNDTVMRISQKNSENMIGAENLDLEGQRRASDATTKLNAQVIEFLKTEDDRLRQEIKACEQDILELNKKNKIYPEELVSIKKQNESLLLEVEESKKQIDDLAQKNEELSRNLRYDREAFEKYKKDQDSLMEKLSKKTNEILKKLVFTIRKNRVGDSKMITKAKTGKTKPALKQKRNVAPRKAKRNRISPTFNISPILNQSDLKVSMEKESLEETPKLQIEGIKSEAFTPQIQIKEPQIQTEESFIQQGKPPEKRKLSDPTSTQKSKVKPLTPINI